MGESVGKTGNCIGPAPRLEGMDGDATRPTAIT
jgi:hypothetical protein